MPATRDTLLHTPSAVARTLVVYLNHVALDGKSGLGAKCDAAGDTDKREAGAGWQVKAQGRTTQVWQRKWLRSTRWMPPALQTAERHLGTLEKCCRHWDMMSRLQTSCPSS